MIDYKLTKELEEAGFPNIKCDDTENCSRDTYKDLH